MERFVQLGIDGLATGAIYALVALALVLIFRSTGMVNLAQGEMAMFSTYVAWQLWEWGAPIGLAIAIAMGFGFALGAAIYFFLVRPVQHQPDLTIVIITLGVFLVLNSLAGWEWSYSVRAFPSAFPNSVWSVDGIQVAASAIGVIGAMALLLALLGSLFRWTRIGLAMRAAAFNPVSSRLVGIPVNRMLMLGWGLSSALGAAAGTLVAPKLFLEPNMMFGVLFYAVAAATVGGLDSPVGAVVSGLAIGVVENLAGSYIGFIGTELKVLVPLSLVVVVLLFFPQGLFGTKRVDRV